MHRWLNAFFALLMVLQFTWAAMGLHGAHEMKAQHPAATTESLTAVLDHVSAQADAPAAGIAEVLCAESSCHGHHVHAAMARDAVQGLLPVQSAAGATAVVALGDSHIPPGLDRPNWQPI